MMNYDALLMLSGGKDSCSLAFKLKEEGLNVLCFTADTSFLSDVAKSNIEKVTRILDFDSVVIKPRPSEYLSIVSSNRTLVQTCTECSKKTMQLAIDMCVEYGVGTLYAGFTLYTAKAQGWGNPSEFAIGGIVVKYPYMTKYNYKNIKALMLEHGLEYDPTKTNCRYIRELIKRDPDNCFEKEIELMREGGQIDDKERDYYSAFVESCRVS